MKFDRFDPLAQRVVEVAQLQALALNHNYVGTEHLLLALTAENFGPATHVLNGAGVTQGAIRGEVVEEVGLGDDPLNDADAEALATLGIDLHEVLRRVEEKFGQFALNGARPCARGGAPERIPLTPRSKKVFELSVSEAQHLGHGRVSPEHLLLALLDDRKALAVKLIRRFGTSAHALRARTLELIRRTAS